MPVKEMTVVEHLEELREKLIVILAAVFPASIIIYFNINLMMSSLLKPIEKFKLDIVYFSLTEGFTTKCKVSLIAAIIIMSPVIFHQVLSFIEPGLTKKEKGMLNRAVISVSLFFAAGVVFGYKVLLPEALNFVISYGESYLNPSLSGNKYFSFIGIFCIGIGVTFILPLFIMLLGKLELISSKVLRKFRLRVVLILIAIEGFFVPAFDFVTFGIMAAPIVVLYELSVWTVFLMEKRRNKAMPKADQSNMA